MEARHIGRYRILEEVGSGGMAVVYKGIDTNLEREVAVKVLHPHLASREESRRRFSREAKAVARLRHPNIVEIFDFSEDEARESFIVTEFVRGRTLRAFGDEDGFGLPEIAAMAAERLAAALEHAHENGIVHRDLKPENVMVREDGALKLMDFGIARMIGGNERMTMTGALVGSPLHMAPEIIEGRDAGEPADIFALGTILYWMVTGQLAFAGNNTTQTLRQILEGQYTDPRILQPSCSDEIAELIGRCLRRDPAERPASMAAVRSELQALLASCGVERIDEALHAFFLEPATYREGFRLRLVESLIASAEKALAEKRSARALALFNRVLALDEGNARVLAALERIKRSRLLRKRMGIGGAIALGLVLAGGVAAQMSRAPPPVVPPVQPPAQTTHPTQASQAAGASERDRTGESPSVPVGADGKAATAHPLGAAADTRSHGAGAATATGSAQQRAEATTTRAEATRAEPLPMQPVQIRWVPQGATLTIDGKPVETTAPAWSGELPAGKHRFALAHPGCCQPWEEELTLAGGTEEVRRSIALAPRENGWFEVDCDLPGAEVWYEGTFKGTVGDVNARGGVPVAFSKDDSGRDRYLKTVRFQVLPPRGREDLAQATAEVTVRAGQKERSQPVRLETRDP